MSAEQDQNPYAAPAFRDATAISPLYQRPLKPHFAWLCMLVINLPIPLYFGFGVTGRSGLIGMLFGTAAVYFCGLWGCATGPRIMYRLNIGSTLVAISQFFPVLHIFVGSMAVGISGAISGDTAPLPHNLSGITATTSATILTGLGLIIPSLVFGTIIVAVFGLDKDGHQLT